MIEKRKSARQRSFLRGFVRLADQNYSMGCIVRDISENGAKLRLKSPASFHGEIELHIPEKKMVVQANVIWKDHCEIGVASIPVAIPDQAPANGALSDRVARLEAEIMVLKQLLSLMRKDDGDRADVA